MTVRWLRLQMLASLLAVCMLAPLLMKQADNGNTTPGDIVRCSTVFVSRQQKKIAARA